MSRRIVKQALNYLIEDLRETHGENLASIVLYGSYAAGDQIELRSDYNLLIALNSITPADLQAAQAPMREWQRLGHPMPVYFTVEELANAADVFPIEFHHMEKARVVLYGRDPFEFLKIADTHLRHQTEYELRTKLLQLRRLYIPASMETEKLIALLGDSLASFAVVFGAVLRLHGAEAPADKADCVRATVKLLGLDPAPFERIFALRANLQAAESLAETNALCADYMRNIQQVVAAVDRMQDAPH